MIECFPVGLLVEFVQGEGVTAKVTALMIEENDHVSYKVAWWNGRARVCEWVATEELKPASAQRTVIGFNGADRMLHNIVVARKVTPLREGKFCKGGQNDVPLDADGFVAIGPRPPAPGGSGSKPDLDMKPIVRSESNGAL